MEITQNYARRCASKDAQVVRNQDEGYKSRGKTRGKALEKRRGQEKTKVGALECDQSSTGLVSETADKEKLREVKIFNPSVTKDKVV